MRVRVDRDSVAAGDDVESHERIVEIPDTSELEAFVIALARVYELPSIAGGKATWALCSRRPLAVMAEEWALPRVLVWRSLSDCAIVDGVPQVHFTYFAQLDPELVLEVLQRLRVEA